MSFLSDLFGNNKLTVNKWFSVVESGQSTKVQEYINKDHSIVNWTDVKEQDALMVAAEKGHKDIVEVLIKAGADANHQNYTGSTALMNAACDGHRDIVEVLLKAGAEVNKSRRGSTALCYAVGKGHKDTVEVLIRAGADVNAYGINGFTPLIRAVLDDDKECVELLVKAGADINVQASDGSSALTIAQEKGYKDIVEVLLNTGVDPSWQYEKASTSHTAAASGRGTTPSCIRYEPRLDSIVDPKFRGIEIVNAGSQPTDLNAYYINIFSKFNIPKLLFEKVIKNIHSLYSVPPGQFTLDDFIFTHMIAMRYGSNNGFSVDADKIFHLYFNDEYGERVFVFIFEK
jgi:ankyrin repeat protein